jgi:type VI secretion system protein ImpH
MATPGRQQDPPVSAQDAPGAELPVPPTDPLAEMRELLERHPYRFDFFQAVRLLERFSPSRKPVGGFSPPSSEVVQFGVNSSVAFPASQIQSLEKRAEAAPLMRINFLGLTGPLGVLPLAYSEAVLERLRARDTGLRDFLDLFHHRMISLFYQAWEKYRFNVAFERRQEDRFTHHLMDLAGLGTEGLQKRLEVPDLSLLFYSGILNLHSRPAIALEQMAGDYFGVPVEVEQFVGRWYPVEEDALCHVGEEDFSATLGEGAVVGDEIWDQQSGIRLRLGPLTLKQYESFLPGGSAEPALRAIARFFTNGELSVEVRLVLARAEVPACELSQGSLAKGPRLGWSSWIRSAPFGRDPEDTVLPLQD